MPIETLKTSAEGSGTESKANYRHFPVVNSLLAGHCRSATQEYSCSADLSAQDDVMPGIPLVHSADVTQLDDFHTRY